MTNDVQQFWDAQASRFDEEPDHGLLDPDVRAAWSEVLLPELPPAPGRVADLGCGTGSITVLLAQAGYDAFPRFELMSFDVVFARHVLWALPDPEAALAGGRGCCDPAGASFWSRDAGSPAPDSPPPSARNWCRSTGVR